MARLLSYLKLKWVGVLCIVAIALPFLLYLVQKLLKHPDPVMPEVSLELKERLERVREEALIEKTKAKIKADAQRAELDEVLKIEDGKERRKRLADLMANLPGS